MVTTPEERAPCPRCGESTPCAGRVCSHCSASLLVDLLPSAPVQDERTAYALARELKAEWPELDLVRAKQALATATDAFVVGVTRTQARQIVERLGDRTPLVHEIPSLASEAQGGGALGPAGRAPRGLLLAAASLLVALVAVFLLRPSGGDGERAPARLQAGAGGELSARQLAERALPAVVSLRCIDSGGSGFLVTNALILTNEHVLCGDEDEISVVFADGREVNARAVRRDRRLDVAVVKLPRPTTATPIELGDATTLRRGDEVLIFGSPRGLDFTLTRGIVSHNARNLRGVLYVQVDANINPGNSGGPLFDAAGRAVGIVSMTVGSETGLGLALPVNYVYEGTTATLSPPRGTDRAAWRALVAQAASEDQRDARELTELYEKPVLADAVLAPQRQLIAIVLRRFPSRAVAESYFFELRRGNELVCTATGEVGVWQRVPEGALTGLDDRTREWARGHGVLAELHSGEATLSLERCPAGRDLMGLDLWIESGDPRTQRIQIEAIAHPLLR